MAIYLATLAEGSRRAQGSALVTIAGLLVGDVPPATVAWHQMRYPHAAALRTRLAATYAPATANRMLAALRGVLRECRRLDLLTTEACAKLLDALPHVRGSRLPSGRALAASELKALFAACDGTTPRGARDAAMLGVLYAAGLRRAECVGLDLADYDAANRTLKVLGKGNKERAVPLEAEGARVALERWLDHRGRLPGPLFAAIHGRTVVLRRLDPQTVRDVLQHVGDHAGVAAFSPHSVRRSYVGALLDAGADLATVQQLAGHASPTTTARYDRRGERAQRRAAALLDVPLPSPNPGPVVDPLK